MHGAEIGVGESEETVGYVVWGVPCCIFDQGDSCFYSFSCYYLIITGRKAWGYSLLDASELYIHFPKWSIKRGSITVANVEMHVIDELELRSGSVAFGKCTCGLGKWCTGSDIEAMEIVGWDPGIGRTSVEDEVKGCGTDFHGGKIGCALISWLVGRLSGIGIGGGHLPGCGCMLGRELDWRNCVERIGGNENCENPGNGGEGRSSILSCLGLGFCGKKALRPAY